MNPPPLTAAPAPDGPLKVALLGCGVVGAQVARLMTTSAADLEARIGCPIELVGIAVRDPSIERAGLDRSLFTTDATALVSRGDLDVVIEVIGGIEPCRELLLRAIEAGASVVTANKALLAAHGQELFEAAEQRGVDLYFEAAVAGAIPIVRPLRESLVGDEITEVMGIVNGTTNFILDQMSTTGASFEAALTEAQRLGFAEADPTADIEGHDAAAKASIVASLAFHTRISGDQVYCEGISQLASADVAAAEAMGFTVKLLAICELTEQNRVSVRVHPAMVPKSHPLGLVKGAYNAIFVRSREAGELMFLGPGAGGAPTASAVMGDLVAVSRNRVRGVAGPATTTYTERGVAPIGEAVSRWFLRFTVRDRPGVLAGSAQIFADHGVSVQTVQQSTEEAVQRDDGVSATLGMLTHEAREADLQACLQQLQHSSFVVGPVRVLRVVGL